MGDGGRKRKDDETKVKEDESRLGVELNLID